MSDAVKSKLQLARAKLGESQSQFAKTLGVPVRSLQNWEQDKATPRGLALTALNEKLDAIVGGK